MQHCSPYRARWYQAGLPWLLSLAATFLLNGFSFGQANTPVYIGGTDLTVVNGGTNQIYINGSLIYGADRSGRISMEPFTEIMVLGDFLNLVPDSSIFFAHPSGDTLFGSRGLVSLGFGVNQQIGGLGPINLHHLRILQSTSLDTVAVIGNLSVAGHLDMAQGKLQIDTFKIPVGVLRNETDANRILGSTGLLMARKSIPGNQPTTDIGGLGAEISSYNGEIEVMRGFQRLSNVSDTSISRFYLVIPDNPASRTAQMKISYLDSDLFGQDESLLGMFISPDSLASWLGLTSVTNPSANYVEIQAPTVLGAIENNESVLTLASADCPNPPQIALPADTFICHSGAITLDPGSNGTSWLWSTGATTQTISVNASGFYTVQVSDGAGCTSRDTINIRFADSIAVSLGGDLDACDGSVLTLDPGPGYGSYNWSTGDTSQSINPTVSGFYDVTVQNFPETYPQSDLSGANLTAGTSISRTVQAFNSGELSRVAIEFHASSVVGTAQIQITFLPSGFPPEVMLVDSVPIGPGLQNFSFPVVLPIEGFEDYEIRLTSNDTMRTVSSVQGFNYEFEVSTFGSCPESDTVEVNFQPLPLAATVTGAFRCGPGSLVLNATTGAGGNVNRWYSDSTRINLLFTGNSFVTPSLTSSRTYYVVSEDTVAACQSDTVSPVTATIAPQLQLSLQTTDVSCNGGSDGAIDLVVLGGTFPFSYSWSTGDSTEDVSGLSAGNYMVTVVDSFGCMETSQVVINQAAPLSAPSSLASATPPSCNGTSDGSIALNVAGGTPPYSYSWSNSQSSNPAIGLQAGTYSYTVSDGNNCTAFDSVVLSEPAAIVLSTTAYPISCNGGGNGAIDLMIQGGVGPFSFNWSNLDTTQNLNQLSAGNYSATVTDANGCTAIASDSVSEPAALSLSTSASHITCNGAADGSIDLTVVGGTIPYAYLWAGPQVSQQEDLLNLPGGIYSVTVTDSNGCIAGLSDTINEPFPIQLGEQITTVSCSGGNTGAVSLTPTGGSQPYSYIWSNGDTSSAVSGLAAGGYSVTLTDANGCTVSQVFNVTDTSQFNGFLTVNHPSCTGVNDGAIDLSLNGGTPPFQFQWSGPGGFTATSEDIFNLAPGTYTVVVSDSIGCSLSFMEVLANPLDLNLAITGIDPVCFGDSTGFLQIIAGGGVPPYSYMWSTGDTLPSINNLQAGTYSVTVTDSLGCNADTTDSLFQPALIVLALSPQDVECFGQGNGEVDLSVAGGVLPYNYSWSNSQTTEDLFAVGPGTYVVTVTDGNSCVAIDSAGVSEPDTLAGSIQVMDVSCNSASDGALDLTVSGGTAPYSYLWSNADTTEDIAGLVAGTYSVLIQDSMNCTLSLSDSVAAADALALTANVYNIGCGGGSDGAIALDVAGGVLPYDYTWQHGPLSDSVSGLSAGTYQVTIQDANNCQLQDSFQVIAPSPLGLSATVFDVGCVGQGDGAVDITVLGGDAPFTYVWSTGDTTEDIVNLPLGAYGVTVTDVRGCTTDSTFSVAEGDSSITVVFVFASVVPSDTSVQFIDLSYFSPTTHHWDFGDGNISTDRHPAHAYADNPLEDTTQYLVQLRVENNFCVDSSSKWIKVVNGSGKSNGDPPNLPLVTSDDILDLRVFPNPNNGDFTMDLVLARRGNVEVHLVDMAGQVLSVQELEGESSYTRHFSTSVSNGMYFLRVVTAKGSKVMKIVIQ